MNNFMNFNLSTGKSENLHFAGQVSKKYRGIVLWKMTDGFKNDVRNLVNFTQEMESNIR